MRVSDCTRRAHQRGHAEAVGALRPGDDQRGGRAVDDREVSHRRSRIHETSENATAAVELGASVLAAAARSRTDAPPNAIDSRSLSRPDPTRTPAARSLVTRDLTCRGCCPTVVRDLGPCLACTAVVPKSGVGAASWPIVRPLPFAWRNSERITESACEVRGIDEPPLARDGAHGHCGAVTGEVRAGALEP